MANNAQLARAREARAAKRGDAAPPRSGKGDTFKKRMSVLVVALVTVGGALLAALTTATAAPDDDEDEDVPVPDDDVPADDEDVPLPGVEDCGVSFEDAKGLLLAARLHDTPINDAQSTANIVIINSLLDRFPAYNPDSPFPDGTATAAEACALQNEVADSYAVWSETDVWPGAEVVDEGGDGGDDEEGGGIEPSGDDEEGGGGGEPDGDVAPCSTADVSAVAEMTLQQLAPYVIGAKEPPQMKEEAFQFPVGDWAALRGYYADAAILVALTQLGEDTEFLHTGTLEDDETCYFKDPTQLKLRNDIRALWDSYHPGGNI